MLENEMSLNEATEDIEKPSFQSKWKNHITNLIKERYPEYDENRYYFSPGDVITLKNRAEVIIMEQGLKRQEIMVIKSGFGMKKGELLTIPIDQFPYFKRGEYVRPPLKIKSEKELKWEIGDIVEDKESIFLLFERCSNSHDFYGMMLQPREGLNEMHSIGSRWHLFHPHRDYVQNEIKK